MKVSPHETKVRILDVAEELFGEHGVDRVSIRDITDAAKVNLAAVNYHFGGKDELIAAVFERRTAPINKARIAALDALEAKARGKALRVEEILEAFILPTVEGAPTKTNKSFAKLFGRCMVEPRPELEAQMRKQFAPVLDRMEKALAKSVPHLKRGDAYWRLKFTYGALHHWMLTTDKFVPEWASKTSFEDQMRKLIAFAAAGFKSKEN